ncbi:PerC family transcriptional regulator [Salmonella enterica subsp. enterica serovar Give]|nr:PerC family transcriptional regulator [Salmonella enterica subsp. enterica serovar Give]EDQ6557277.1 PerC family transcriptional regulator [Salmonella enterica subsp. enterica]EED3922971.1 PerC family transcriptional regulator [Salmonella enterica subsp. enterica serovar Give]EED4548080.1 PerC family transcriptional regulator [Salmonella enterica subsp. enterica serovar Give]
MVEDEVAQKLEAAGLWRRAASRWLDVMQHHGLTDQQRDRIRQHRKYCLSCTKPISSPEKLDVAEIARAAKATQERMGLSQPGGAAFRLKDREKIAG